ncbi:MAG TPA: type II toxin-antitoxin system HicA family toxin [Bacteroidetes bacterium]|nr:type II toxin-antitoxin system HicA family toxin [Bacteroidota bacterium]
MKKLKKFGFIFYRQASGSHEIWYNEKTEKFTTIPNHTGDCPGFISPPPFSRYKRQKEL